MFLSAIASENRVRATASVDHERDPAFWSVIQIAEGVELHSKLLNADTDYWGQLISAATSSGVYHSELWIDYGSQTDAVAKTRSVAESMLGQEYDWEGAALSFTGKGYHEANKKWCSEFCAIGISAILNGLFLYPTPGKLLLDLSAMLGLDKPKTGSPPAAIGDDCLRYLDSLVPSRLASGTAATLLSAMGVG